VPSSGQKSKKVTGSQRVPTVAIRIAGHTPRDLATYLGELGIFTWDGNYYALNLSERLGVEPSGGMLRIGLVHYNTSEEVDRLLAALKEPVKTRSAASLMPAPGGER
jgi:selenocysteine lyase/cysteine desulfurase